VSGLLRFPLVAARICFETVDNRTSLHNVRRQSSDIFFDMSRGGGGGGGLAQLGDDLGDHLKDYGL
jgi:hypothetical protein